MQGIDICKMLKSLNLSCNAIEDISPLRALSALESLDLKANRIRSLKGIDHLRKLIKVDASQNRIETLEGIGEGNSQLQCLILYKNGLKDVGELSRFHSFR
jgi:Leucine-rich repeat (LRR) protein